MLSIRAQRKPVTVIGKLKKTLLPPCDPTKMTKTKKIIYSTLIFLLATLSAFYFEEYYRTLIRLLYKYFTADSISFIGKNFHFTSLYFLIAFGLFCLIMRYNQLGRNFSQVFLSILLVTVLFFLTTTVISYFSSQLKIIECTACNDGKRSLQFNGINYDLIFMSSLFIATLPILIKKIRNRMKASKKANL